LQEEDAAFDSDRFIRDVLKKHAKLKYAPGEKFAYSNLNYLLLGQIIEKVSGISYRDYIRQRILSRLDLDGNHLDFTVEEDRFYARGYQKRFSPINLILGFFINKKKFMIRSSHPAWIKFKKYYVSGRAYGGMIASAWSLARFLSTLMKPRSVLLSDEWKNTLFTKQKTSQGEEVEMTLGWFTGKLNEVDYFGHAGAGGGYYCEMRMYPETQIVSAIMFNRTGMRDEHFLDKADSYFFPGLG
jgi:D-alanyl-D-alanine carboxypeptidase